MSKRDLKITAPLIRSSILIVAKHYGYSPEMLLTMAKTDSKRCREIIGVKWHDDLLSIHCKEKCGCIAHQVSMNKIPNPREIFPQTPRGPFLFYCAARWLNTKLMEKKASRNFRAEIPVLHGLEKKQAICLMKETTHILTDYARDRFPKLIPPNALDGDQLTYHYVSEFCSENGEKMSRIFEASTKSEVAVLLQSTGHGKSAKLDVSSGRDLFCASSGPYLHIGELLYRYLGGGEEKNSLFECFTAMVMPLIAQHTVEPPNLREMSTEMCADFVISELKESGLKVYNLTAMFFVKNFDSKTPEEAAELFVREIQTKQVRYLEVIENRKSSDEVYTLINYTYLNSKVNIFSI